MRTKIAAVGQPISELVAIRFERKLPSERPPNDREDTAAWVRDELARAADRMARRFGPDGVTALSGLEPGVPLWWAQAAIDRGMGLHGWAAYAGQDKHWTAEDQRFYRTMIENCDEFRACYGAGNAGWKHWERDAEIVRQADVPIVVWSGRGDGSTTNVVAELRKAKRRFYWIDPLLRRSTWDAV
jgi:hypothetical protein